MSTAQQKAFIDNLKGKLQGKSNPEYTKFLNECVQRYNAAVSSGVASVPSSKTPTTTSKSSKKKVIKRIVFAVAIITIGIIAFNNIAIYNNALNPTPELLVGTWLYNGERNGISNIFNADGSYLYRTASLSYDGRWELSGNRVTLTLDPSSVVGVERFGFNQADSTIERLTNNPYVSYNVVFKNNREMFKSFGLIFTIGNTTITIGGSDNINYFQRSNTSSSSSSDNSTSNISSNNTNSTTNAVDLFSQISVSNVTIREAHGSWSMVYADVRNNSDVVIGGYLRAVAYQNGSILGDTLLSLGTPGVSPGNNTVVSGYIRTEDIQGYDDVVVYSSSLTQR